MIKLFGSAGPDHPMADPKEAKRILDELPALDPIKALEELGHWHESLSLAEGFRPEPRIRLLLQVDDAAQGRVKKITRDYLSPVRLTRVQENRLWTAAHGYWHQSWGDDAASAQVQIALRPGVFAPGQNLEATRGGRPHVYLPTGFGECGEDYEIGRFRELVREV